MSDSRSRSKSPRRDRDRSKSPDEDMDTKPARGGEVDVLKISNDDAAFILGKNGKTKEKIARVSGAEIDLFEHSLTLEIRGEDAARGRAKKYIECVMAQRVGPVTIDEQDHDADDLTTISVPSEAVGFVTGAQGNFLRSVEEEWGTLMFFADFRGKGRGREGDTEKLAIFGPQRGRRGAQLKVMAAVETKVPGYFTDKQEEDVDGVEFGTKTLVLKPDELSYALGKKGMTRKKLARSSGCIVEYVGYTVFMSGSADERARAQEYLSWLFDQLKVDLP